MFRKRVKKEFPPGTFIPTPARVMAIIQLSLALLVLLWQMSQPFMGELFAVRSKLTLYEYVTGAPGGSALQQRNAARFQALPLNTQEAVRTGYAHWEEKLHDTFWHKLRRSAEAVLFEMPLFEKVWLLLSLVLPVLILLKVEGSIAAAWLIPLAVFAYAVDNRWNGEAPALTRELSLFPTEAYLQEHYPAGAVDPNPFAQREQLADSWHRYLVAEWADGKGTAEDGEHAFTTARALAAADEAKPTRPIREAHVALLVYLLWNIAFAYVVTKWTSEKRVGDQHTVDHP